MNWGQYKPSKPTNAANKNVTVKPNNLRNTNTNQN